LVRPAAQVHRAAAAGVRRARNLRRAAERRKNAAQDVSPGCGRDKGKRGPGGRVEAPPASLKGNSGTTERSQFFVPI
jgi:hypothetical protein